MLGARREWCERRDSPVLRAALPLGRDNGLQVLALPPLGLAAVTVGRLRDRLRLVDGGLLDVGAIHRELPRHALAHGSRRGGEMDAIRPSRAPQKTSSAGDRECCPFGYRELSVSR